MEEQAALVLHARHLVPHSGEHWAGLEMLGEGGTHGAWRYRQLLWGQRAAAHEGQGWSL